MPSRSYDRQRTELVETLRSKGITDERVLDALARVPRHAFVEPALVHRAYEDEALPIGLKQTISQPFTVAYQTVLLEVREGDKVLEVGTGSGYQAAVLAELGAHVFSVERHEPLLRRTEALLEELGYRIRTRLGDGTRGWPGVAPFDAIVVTAGGRDVPASLLEQLREPSRGRRGGRLIIPVGSARKQTMWRITRIGPGEGPEAFEREAFHDFRFVPLISDPEA
jgi:protein-L-isoaspartate(D-aspartate) O-methyltransferase